MNEFISNLDNWGLIKTFGGITIVLSSVISYIAILIKNRIELKWQEGQGKEIETLKGQINQNNMLIVSLSNSISSIYLSSNSKRIESLEKVWAAMLNVKNLAPDILFLTSSLLTRDEVNNLTHTQNEVALESLRKFNLETCLGKLSEVRKEIESTRPLFGEELWIIYNVYEAFFGRLVYIIYKGIKDDHIEYWIDDENIIKILKLVINEDDLKTLTKVEIQSFTNIVNYLESRAIKEISEQISGKKISHDTVRQTMELVDIVNNEETFKKTFYEQRKKQEQNRNK